MILLFAGRGTARTVRRLLRQPGSSPPGRIVVLEPAGLAVSGWTHDPADPRADRIVTGGQACQASRLTAVITGLDAVHPADLPAVTAADRDFVAAELTAFLRTWLTSLACPVIDRPTPLALGGPAADRAAWAAAAATLGVPQRLTAPVRRTSARTVTVAAGRIAGPAASPAQAAAALALAATAGVTAARVTFGGHEGTPGEQVLAAAGPWWHLPTPAVLRALLDHATATA